MTDRSHIMGRFEVEPVIHMDPLDYEIAHRFKSERHPEATVDGEDSWDIDPFAEEEL